MKRRSIFQGLNITGRYEDAAVLPQSSYSQPTELQSRDSLESLFQSKGSVEADPSRPPHPVSCLRKSARPSSAQSSPKRTYFSAHISKVISISSSDSGWWTSAELRAFRERVRNDSKLATHMRRNRANSVDANYDYDEEDKHWLKNFLGTATNKRKETSPPSNPQQPPNTRQSSSSRPPSPLPPLLELTSETEKSVGTLKISPPLPVKVDFVLIASQEPVICLLLTEHIVSLYPSIARSNIYVISSLTQKLTRDIPFDVVFVESSFSNSHLIGAYYRHSHPKTLVVGLDRPNSSLRHPSKLCHMIWPLPPPRSDDALKAR